MQQIIEAVYENGVFRPLKAIELSEGEKVQIVVNADRPETQLTQTELLQRIEQRRTFSPEQHHLPDTLTLLQDDRDR